MYRNTVCVKGDEHITLGDIDIDKVYLKKTANFLFMTIFSVR